MTNTSGLRNPDAGRTPLMRGADRVPDTSPAHEAPGSVASGSRPAMDGQYVDGLRHGLWRIVHPDGSVEEGRYVTGRLHGEWRLRNAAGRIVAREFWHHGRARRAGHALRE